jgi:GTP-binding protein
MAEEAASPDAESAEDAAARALEHGRWLFAQDCRFLLGVVKAGDVPDLGHSEVAFAGRSNVGKSSLVNALTGRKTLARTSNTPGRTQQLNFFDLGERLVLVDLPGYGYARASKSKVKDWTGLTRAYLRGRAALRRVCLLIDARHGFKESDRQIMTVLDGAAVSYQVIFTKADKTTAARQIAASQSELARRPAAHPEVLATSALAGRGVPELRAALAAFAQAD